MVIQKSIPKEMERGETILFKLGIIPDFWFKEQLSTSNRYMSTASRCELQPRKILNHDPRSRRTGAMRPEHRLAYTVHLIGLVGGSSGESSPHFSRRVDSRDASEHHGASDAWPRIHA